MVFQSPTNRNKAITVKKMETTTEFDPQMMVFIPRMNTFWANPERITEVFYKQNIGRVSRVDIIKRKVSNKRKRDRKHIGGDYIRSAHVYFTAWYDTVANHNLQARILDPKREARIVFDEPWYWLLIESQRNKDEQRLLQTEDFAYSLAEEVNYLHKCQQETVEILQTQNAIIQRLQDYCISQGLEIPFWDGTHPPSAEVSSLEALAAETAVHSAEHVLQDEDDFYPFAIVPSLEDLTEETAVQAAEYVLREDEEEYFNDAYSYSSEAIRGNADFIPLPWW